MFGDVMAYVDMFWPFLVLVVVFYFFMYRPQKKQEMERSRFLKALKKGDKVVTAGGIHGVIRQLHEKEVLLEIAPKTVITLERGAIQRSASAVSAEEDDDEEVEYIEEVHYVEEEEPAKKPADKTEDKK